MHKVLSCLGSAGCAAQVAGAEGWQSHQASFQSCLTHFCSPGKVFAACMTGLLLCTATCFPAAIAAIMTALKAAALAAYACPPIFVHRPGNIQQSA